MWRSSILALCALACGGESDVQYRADVGTQMRDALSIDLLTLVSSAQTIQEFAPVTQGRGWDPQADAVAIQNMKVAWENARSAYEHVEGAVALIHPDSDFAIDARYEQYLAAGPDAYAFDDKGVVGLDAIERVLWSDAIPAQTVAFESTLAGYAPAAFPATEQEASDFKNVLCGKLIADATALQVAWRTEDIDVSGAFDGLMALIGEQQTEISHAQNGAEESRYSQLTMDDLRSNVDGVEAIYGIFRPWIATKDGGSDMDAKIESGFATLDDLYGNVPGDAVPDASSAAYTELLGAVTTAVDPSHDGSIVFEMTRARSSLGL